MSSAKTKITINEITAPVLLRANHLNMIGDDMQINSKLAANPFSVKQKSFSFLVPKSNNVANLKRPVTSLTSSSLATSTNNTSDMINSLIFNRNGSTNLNSSNGNWLKTKTSLSSNLLLLKK